jgi:hypothetical protein
MRWWLWSFAACGHLGFAGAPPADDTVPSDGPIDADATIGTTRPNVAFVTSMAHDGNFNGLANADAFCQGFADAQQLHGRFIAFLGTSTEQPVARLVGSRGWVTTTGFPVYDRPDDILAETQIYPLDVNELQMPVSGEVFTGTDETGMANGSGTCNDWMDTTGTARVGSTHSTSGDAVAAGSTACSGSLPIYCFEIGNSFQVAGMRVPGGQFVFTTAQLWMVGGGRPSADAVCKSEAMAGGLPQTNNYLALLATAAESPLARLSLSTTLRRTDGLAVGGSLSALVTAVNRDAHGDPILGSQPLAWLGTDQIGSPNTNTCLDWTSSTTATGTQGIHVDSIDLPQTHQSINCSTPRHLICIQQ